LTKNPCKGSLLWRVLFFRVSHPQGEVCGGSMNSSTKYTIHCRRGVRYHDVKCLSSEAV
jgi:hypothetical protein